ncbi:RNA methyltransferase, TrmH family [Prevotella sp. khp7]|uniref:TrmH family RNA methyltransferase n=1 Tax=Prevotella sp. khp7 TaxID=1761885 RepID=UPI0008C52C48|nr:RNA methyltransferase [Prevotella sp. khp7]SEW10486.1 RNA methyltransferase, TrmH family [Prevotella sp. khp7]
MEENIITSVQNARIKHVVALQQKSSLRREEGLFVVEGQREIEHCIACGYEVVELFVLNTIDYSGSIAPTFVTPQVYEKMAYRGSTEGIIAVVRCKEHSLLTLCSSLSAKPRPLIVVLESVEKPGNLGAILRTAEAAKVDAVIVCDPLTDLYNPNLIRASIGGVFCVPVAVCTSGECIAFLKEHDIRILTAQLQDSYEYYDYDMRHATAIVMGTESTGLTDQWREAADAHIRIPMLGRLDSLNVSVSAAILMYEAVRQRQSKL